jgi:hypothetical protein
VQQKSCVFGTVPQSIAACSCSNCAVAFLSDYMIKMHFNTTARQKNALVAKFEFLGWKISDLCTCSEFVIAHTVVVDCQAVNAASCVPRRWPGFDPRPDLLLVWKSWLFSITLHPWAVGTLSRTAIEIINRLEFAVANAKVFPHLGSV